MKKRRMLKALTMVLICIFMVSACKKNVGTPEDNAVASEPEESAPEEKDTYVFGFTGIDMENPYFITLESAVRESVENAGDTMITKDPASDPELQKTQIQELIDEGIDAIFLCPVDWEANTESLEALKEAYVKIINVDTQLKEIN